MRRSAGTPGSGRGCRPKPASRKVFYYYFDQHPEYPADSPRAGYGSPHGADVPYVFQHLNPRNPRHHAERTRRFRRRWPPTGRTSPSAAIPTAQGVPTWPAFSDTNPSVMYFSQTPHPGPVPSADALRGARRVFRLAPDAGRRGVGQVGQVRLPGRIPDDLSIGRLARNGPARCRPGRPGSKIDQAKSLLTTARGPRDHRRGRVAVERHGASCIPHTVPRPSFSFR